MAKNSVSPRFFENYQKYKPDVLITEGFFQWTPMVILYSLLYKTPVFMGYERTMHTERNCNLLKKFIENLPTNSLLAI